MTYNKRQLVIVKTAKIKIIIIIQSKKPLIYKNCFVLQNNYMFQLIMTPSFGCS